MFMLKNYHIKIWIGQTYLVHFTMLKDPNLMFILIKVFKKSNLPFSLWIHTIMMNVNECVGMIRWGHKSKTEENHGKSFMLTMI